MSKKNRAIHYVPSSHWDREWYQTFQDYRARLVGLLDRVVTRLESARLAGPFTCDGQSIVIADYLEIRPENTGRIRKLLEQGKLVAGPWYVMPDEFLVSGESIVRNLRKGMETAASFGGEPSRAGFVCDLFGHCSQLPQIFRGFGIGAALVWRGVARREDARFHWIGADGTRLPAYRFGKSGYCDFANKVRRSHEPGTDFNEESALGALRAFVEEELRAVAPSGPALLFDGGDHLEMDLRYYDLLKSSALEWNIEHSTLDRFVSELIESFGEVRREWHGELREPAFEQMSVDQAFLIPGVASSRHWIKKGNADCQTLLCSWAEPLSALANLRTGLEWPERYLEVAWEWLLQNHPHDSICGCSIDEVHEDMKYRFSQTRQIASRLAAGARQNLTAGLAKGLKDRELRLSLFYPGQAPYRGPVDVTLEIPADWPEFTDEFGFENKPAFRIFRPDGTEVPYQRIFQNRNASRTRIRPIKFPELIPVRQVGVVFEAEIPALGYTSLLVRGDESNGPDAAIAVNIHSTRHPASPGIALSSTCLVNEFLKVDAGTSVHLLDRTTGQSYNGLLEFEDAADIGDGWYHHSPVNDQRFTSVGSPRDIALLHNGPFSAALKITTRMRVPEFFDFAASIRSASMVELVIESVLTLRKGCPFLEVETTVVNQARDHRLRVLFPSGAKTQTYLADSAFDVVERQIALRADNHLYREMEIEAKPQQSWTAVFDSVRGLAVVSDGSLLEGGVRDTPERPILQTLYRSTGRTVMTTGQPGGQLMGHEMKFRFRIHPLGGTPDRTTIFQSARQLAAGISSCQLLAKDVVDFEDLPALPSSDGLFQMEGHAVLSSATMRGNRLEVRMFNPWDRSVHASLIAGDSLVASKAEAVDFLSLSRKKKLNRRGRKIGMILQAKEILTLSIPTESPAAR